MAKYIKHRLFAPLLILFGGLITTFVIVQSISFAHFQSNADTFRFAVDRRANAIQALVNKDIQLIGSAANFYFASHADHWRNFEDFAPYVLRGSDTLIALEWMENIPTADFNARAEEVRSYFPDFAPYTVIDKEMVSGPPTGVPDQFVLTDVMPRTPINLGLLGFYSSQERFQYIVRQIQRSGEPVISDKVRLLQDGTDAVIAKNGILVYHPVFDDSGQNLKGIVIGVLRISSYIDTLLNTFDKEENISLQILDTGFEAEDDSTLYIDSDWRQSEYVFVRNIYLPNRIWEAHFSFQNLSSLEQKISLSLIGLAGLLITLTLAALFYYLNNERMIIGKLLADRTRALEQIAYQDPLTGLANRREFDKRLLSRINQAVPFGLIVIDLDDFKQINDHHGHAIGDDTLVSVAERIKEQLQESELLARVGGDEMAILCASQTPEELALRAKALCTSIAEIRISESGKMVAPQISIGGAIWTKGSSEDGLRKAADQALYRAKYNGKNQYVIADPTQPSAH